MAHGLANLIQMSIVDLKACEVFALASVVACGVKVIESRKANRCDHIAFRPPNLSWERVRQIVI